MRVQRQMHTHVAQGIKQGNSPCALCLRIFIQDDVRRQTDITQTWKPLQRTHHLPQALEPGVRFSPDLHKAYTYVSTSPLSQDGLGAKPQYKQNNR